MPVDHYISYYVGVVPLRRLKIVGVSTGIYVGVLKVATFRPIIFPAAELYGE